MLNSTTCANAAQKTQLSNLKKLLNTKPPMQRKAAIYHLTNPNTYSTHAKKNEGPLQKEFESKWIHGSGVPLGGRPWMVHKRSMLQNALKGSSRPMTLRRHAQDHLVQIEGYQYGFKSAGGWPIT